MKKLILSTLLVGGLISAQASVFLYSVSFSDVGEAQASPGATGTGTVSYDNVSQSLTLSANFSGLIGNVTQSHIHVSPTPFSGSGGIAVTSPSLPGFPTGATSGTYGNTLNLTLTSSFNATYLANNGGTGAGAESAFAAHMAAGRAYWNIHTSFGPGGEIRAFLTAVPEPSSLALLGLGAAAIAVRSRKVVRK
jgi:CHRD domain/PEP-CTERM motif